MGIRFLCPSGHKLNVKNFLAGKRAICPECGAKVIVPDLPPEPVAQLPPAGHVVAKPFAASAEIDTGSPFDTASPSVVLAVAESAATAAAAPAGLPESMFAAPSPIVNVVDSDPTASEMQSELRRDRTRRNQMTLLVVLAMVVIFLAGVLVWVLNREPAAPEPTEEESKQVSVTSTVGLEVCHRRA